jgi:uncharacterized protein YicC (UPF0701 family)
MIQSMTGFGRAEVAAGGWRCTVELRSVNSRHLEFRARLPAGLTQLEETLRKRLRGRCERGKVEGSIALVAEGGEFGELVLDRAALERYGRLVREVAQHTGIQPQVTLGDLLNAREPILRSALEGDSVEAQALVEQAFGQALEALVAMRAREGAALAEDFRNRIGLLRGHLDAIVPLTRDLPQQNALRLREHLARLVGLAGDPAGTYGSTASGPRFTAAQEERIHLEIALLADHCDVTEEVARFGTHLDHVGDMLTEGGALGRKFEFLLQELQREANTLSVKSSQPQVSARVVEIKTEIERMREQIQNIE